MATYYVRSSGGSNANNGLSFANAFATIIYAETQVVAGDTVLICADGTHLPTTSVDFKTAAGTSKNWITYRGCSAAGVDDGTRATVSGASTSSGEILFQASSASGKNYINFENLRITGSKGVGFFGRQSVAGWRFANCRIDNSVGAGINTYYPVQMVNCEIDNNGGAGVSEIVSLSHTLIRCAIHHNSGHGVRLGLEGSVIACRIYKNTDRGIFCTSPSPAGTGPPVRIVGNTIHGNTSHGIECPSAWTNILLSHNILSSNGGYGLYLNGGGAGGLWTCYRNNVHGNTSGVADFGSSLPGFGHLVINPNYTSTTNNAEDFTPGNTSLKMTDSIAGGTGVYWIGAVEPSSSGSGGTNAYVFGY